MDYGAIISTIISLLSKSDAAAVVVKALLSAIGTMFTTLKVPESDMNVEWAQKALKKLGFDPGTVDNIMGPKTQAAIVKYQQSKGYEPDGWLGGQTQTQLRIDAGEV